MDRILMHAGLTPLDRPDMDDVFAKRLFTTNSGNLLFQYAAFRTMMTEDTAFVTAFLDRRGIPDGFFERVNAECSCAILPMSNNFRRDYNLKQLTESVHRLRIPCVVTGVGLQAGRPEQIRDGFPFDADVRAFVSAVLDRSAMLGVRGEITADYLTRLGFAAQRHFTVIGCPSLYAVDGRLPRVRRAALTPDSPVSINYRKEQPAPLFEVMRRAMDTFPNYRLLFQRVEELFMLRYGIPIRYDYRIGMGDKGPYPRSRRDPSVRGGHAIGFVNVPAWLDFMRTMRFSFGCRIHGNLSAVLTGTPAMVFSIDTRTEELCRYHNIPHLSAAQMREDVDLFDLYEKTDFDIVHQGHEQRFRRYVDFLNANGLKHIYRNTLTPQSVPLDRALAALPEWGRIENPEHISPGRRFRGLAMRLPRLKSRLGQRLRRIGH